MPRSIGAFFLTLLLTTPIHADGSGDNDPTNVRRVPPLGVDVPADVRGGLENQLDALRKQIEGLHESKDSQVQDLLPDIEIYERAVRSALQHQEFFSDKEFDQARQLLRVGLDRATALTQGPSHADWTRQTGLVVRGYRSKIDRTPQPYGLVIPEGLPTGRRRLDIWFHGRGERLSEVGFLHQRMNHKGEYTPANTIVLHPYGRYCNAFKFAGEVDVLEALESTQLRYAIDPDRISVRGFSMGGAAAWQFAVLYPDRWFAANPGAGFSETPEFLRFFQQETLNPTWYERKLWQWYDCNGYAINLRHCPTIAYSGELDSQKQAADIMEAALAKEHIALVHIIGPQTKHSIHPESKVEIERRLAELARGGRDRLPKKIDLRTYTLRYNRMHWITIDALSEHWVPTTVSAELGEDHSLKITTKNVAALTVDFPAGTFRDIRRPIACRIDNTDLASQRPASDRSLRIQLHQSSAGWQMGPQDGGLRKHHNLQGPIDDAFMDSFIFVRPTNPGGNEAVDAWVSNEFEHATTHWRQQFRGESRIKADTEISEEDIAGANLVLFGTPESNPLLARIADRLPITWRDASLQVGEAQFDAQHHVPILIYPNPLNPSRYIVLNSGFTYREYAYLNNARQVPMLPDWAIVDIRTPPSSQSRGKVVTADFFDEQWQLK